MASLPPFTPFSPLFSAEYLTPLLFQWFQHGALHNIEKYPHLSSYCLLYLESWANTQTPGVLQPPQGRRVQRSHLFSMNSYYSQTLTMSTLHNPVGLTQTWSEAAVNSLWHCVCGRGEGSAGSVIKKATSYEYSEFIDIVTGGVTTTSSRGPSNTTQKTRAGPLLPGFPSKLPCHPHAINVYFVCKRII